MGAAVVLPKVNGFLEMLFCHWEIFAVVGLHHRGTHRTGTAKQAVMKLFLMVSALKTIVSPIRAPVNLLHLPILNHKFLSPEFYD